MKSVLSTCCALLTILAIWSAGAEPMNHAPKAEITANSEYSTHYRARFVADGHIPESGDQAQDREWAVQGETHRNGAELIMKWARPVQIAELVYYGRVTAAVEGWKGFEIYLDDANEPVTEGNLRSGKGPQRIPLGKTVQATTLCIKFTSSFGSLNPGAAEIQVFDASPPDSLIGTFLPLPPYQIPKPDSPPPPKEPSGRADLPPWVSPPPSGFDVDPYAAQIEEQLELLRSDKASTRVVALENLFLMRSYDAAPEVAQRLDDPSRRVRCQAAITLGRIGSRAQFSELLSAMEDRHWCVRQSAFNTLSTLSGLDLPFGPMGEAAKRTDQIAAWREAVASLDADDLAHAFANACHEKAPWLDRERRATALWASRDVLFVANGATGVGKPGFGPRTRATPKPPAWLKDAGPNLARKAKVTVSGNHSKAYPPSNINDGRVSYSDDSLRWVSDAKMPA